MYTVHERLKITVFVLLESKKFMAGIELCKFTHGLGPVPIVISVAFSSLLGLSLKNDFDYYYSAIPDYFYPCYPLSNHSKFFPFIYSMLLYFFMGLVYLICIAALPDRCGVRFCSVKMPFLINFSLGWIFFVVLF